MKRAGLLGVACALALGAGVASAKKPKVNDWVATVWDGGRMGVFTPLGWEGDVDAGANLGKLELKTADGQGKFSVIGLELSDTPIGDIIKKRLPDAKQKVSKKWTCAEGTIATFTVGVCGSKLDNEFLILGFAAEPKLYKKMGGLKKLQWVGEHTFGFPVFTPDTPAAPDPNPATPE